MSTNIDDDFFVQLRINRYRSKGGVAFAAGIKRRNPNQTVDADFGF